MRDYHNLKDNPNDLPEKGKQVIVFNDDCWPVYGKYNGRGWHTMWMKRHKVQGWMEAG